jgi:hypothetical protein
VSLSLSLMRVLYKKREREATSIAISSLLEEVLCYQSSWISIPLIRSSLDRDLLIVLGIGRFPCLALVIVEY